MTWPTVKLGDICEIYAGGGAPQLEGDFCDDGIPFIRAGSLPKLLNGIQECQLEKINALTANQYRLKLYKKDAIVFAKSGMSATKGHIYRLKNSCYIVNHLAILKPLDACCPNYLEHALKKYSPTSLILDPAYPSIRLSDIASFKLPLPPLAEQQRIAAILDKAELVKRKRELAIEKLDELAQSVFDEMFGNLDTNEKKWKVGKFESQFKSIRYGTGSPPEYVASGLPFIRATNIKKGGVNQKGIKFISTDSAKKIEKCKVAYGNLIIVRSGVNTGDCAVIPKELSGAYAAFDLILDIDIKKGYFYNFLLNSRYGKRLIEPLTRRAAQPHLNADQVKGLPLIQPDDELIDTFFNRLKEIQALIDVKKKALSKSIELFKSLENSIFYE